MGVPKFFRWISARYPCINQVVTPDEVPEIDHLYLDMNGILHNCSHPEGVSKLMNEEVIFGNVRNYIEYIFNLIKPCKTFFMAVDGVAPRAKMTQQRARRFQAAQEANEEIQIALRKGQPVKERFDSCIISPGTEFMERMHQYLREFISDRVLNSNEWRNVDVYLSGHDCPGEGEHKIREFISYRREQSNYIPNERHCIYGMDADLIFLGLTTHEMNMCILRENVIKARTCLAEETPFCITYVTLVREYIECEFKGLKNNLSFPYNLEHIIDDWIFMAFLLGNDFIPHLPNLHIHAESLLVLWDTYHVVLPKLDGYLVEFGRLNIARFDRYLEELSKFEQQWFEDREADHRWMRGKRGHQMARQLETLGQDFDNAETRLGKVNRSANHLVPRSSSPVIAGDVDNVAAFTNFFAPDQNDQLEADCPDEYEDLLQEGVINIFPNSETSASGGLVGGRADKESGSGADDESDYGDDSTTSDEDELIYRMHRRDYYSTKLSLQIDQPCTSQPGSSTSPDSCDNVLLPIVRDYLRMLQWILSYYFLKVVDWQFFYAYHYAPFVCDLRIFTRQFTDSAVPKSPRGNSDWADFTLDTQPVKPFVQQLMIMPADAAYIVPAAYRHLMTEPNSPVAAYFPKQFATDLNGKISAWEAIALIPFIDETVLVKVMAPLHKLLSKQELRRNQHKHHLLFPASIGVPTRPIQKLSHDFFRKHICNLNDSLPSFYAGLNHEVASEFPSLLRRQFTTSVMKIPVHVFEQPSKLDSLVIRLPDYLGQMELDSDLTEVARGLLGKAITVRWPYHAAVLPVCLMTSGHIWELEDFNISPGQLQKLENPTSVIHHRAVDPVSERTGPVINSQWFMKQIHELYRHYQVRRAIIVDSDGEKDLAQEPAKPVLLFSRRLQGWHVKRKMTKRNGSTFTLVPFFAKSLAENGDKLRASASTTGPRSSSAWLGRRSAHPSIKMGPAFGEFAGLSLDLLDMAIPGELRPPHVRRCASVARKFAFGLDTIFSAGQTVISLTPKFYGQAGEVIGLVPRSASVVVQFYPFCRTWLDTSHLRTKFKSTASTDCQLDDRALARHLQMHPIVVARITGTLFVQLSGCPDACGLPNADTVEAGGKPRVYNIGLNLRNRTKSQFLGWSYFSPFRKTWLFSESTKHLLLEYVHLFPKLWCQLSDQWSNQDSTNQGTAVLDLTEPEISAVIDFLTRSPHSTADSIPNQGEYLFGTSIDRLRSLVSAGQSNDTAQLLFQPINRKKWGKESGVLCTPESLLVFAGKTVVYPSYHFTCLSDGVAAAGSSSTELEPNLAFFNTFHLWDRVVYCGQNSVLRFGLAGTVIGLPNGEASELVEVMFDYEFPEAIDIRGCGPRCARIRRSSLLCLPKSHLMARYLQGGSSKLDKPTNQARTPRSNQNTEVADRSTNNSTCNGGDQGQSLQPPIRESKAWPKATVTGNGDILPVKQPGREPVLTGALSEKISVEKSEILELNALLTSCQLKSNPDVTRADDYATHETSSLSLSPNDTTDDSVVPPAPPCCWSTSVSLVKSSGPTDAEEGRGQVKRDKSRPMPSDLASRSASRQRKAKLQSQTSKQASRPVHRRTPHEVSHRPPPPPSGGFVGHNCYYPQSSPISPGGDYQFQQQAPAGPYQSNWYPPPVRYRPLSPEAAGLQFAYGCGYPAAMPYYPGGMNFRQYSYPGPPPPTFFRQALTVPEVTNWVSLNHRPMVVSPAMHPPAGFIQRPRNFIPPQVARKRSP